MHASNKSKSVNSKSAPVFPVNVSSLASALVENVKAGKEGAFRQKGFLDLIARSQGYANYKAMQVSGGNVVKSRSSAAPASAAVSGLSQLSEERVREIATEIYGTAHVGDIQFYQTILAAMQGSPSHLALKEDGAARGNSSVVCSKRLQMDGFELRVYQITRLGKDPIHVFVEEQADSTAGRVTVQCYANSWTAFWGNHGEESLESFFVNAHSDYLVNSFMWGIASRLRKPEAKQMEMVLSQIISAIKREFVGKFAQEA